MEKCKRKRSNRRLYSAGIIAKVTSRPQPPESPKFPIFTLGVRLERLNIVTVHQQNRYGHTISFINSNAKLLLAEIHFRE
eukprot:TRINITY_DN3314_c0_g1_i1.p2 TRINITY_DN3314_c0_g1~~TRINITY_DN3314_c0_g1_i1.p2  ORF type:complete len:80 (+),score=10.68 TRINITY_DN3314_c0_g1_i1:238-477(+)